LATSLPATASCDQYGSNSLAPQPTQEGRPLFRVTKIVKAQFKLPSRAEAESRLNPHFTRRSSRDYAADAIFPKYAFQATPCTQGLPGCGKSPFGCHSVSDELNSVKPHEYGAAREVQWPCIFIFLTRAFCFCQNQDSFPGITRWTQSLHHPSLRPRTATMIRYSELPDDSGRQGAHSNDRSPPATTE